MPYFITLLRYGSRKSFLFSPLRCGVHKETTEKKNDVNPEWYSSALRP